MSNITYTTENHRLIEEWIDSCPREVANLITVAAFQVKADGTMNHIGIYSVKNTKRGDCLQMLDEAIDELQSRKNELFEDSAIQRLQRMLDRCQPPM